MRFSSLALLLTLSMVAVSCGDNDDDTAPPANDPGGNTNTGALTTSSPARVQMTIDGVTYSYAEGNVHGIVFGGGGGVMPAPDSSQKTYSMSIYPLADDMLINFNVDLGVFRYLGGQPTNAQFLGFMPVGPVVYGNTEVVNDRVKLSWWDENGVEWSTQCGTALQPAGSSFVITEVVDVPVPFNFTQRKMRVTFNCRLYNCLSGSSFKTVTNGTGIFHFDNI